MNPVRDIRTAFPRPKLTFRYLILGAGLVWLSGILLLLLLNVTGRFTNTEAIGIGQIWTEAVGFTFAAGSLYLAWRGTLTPRLTLSFESGRHVTHRRIAVKRDPLFDVPLIDLYLRNESTVGARNPRVELTAGLRTTLEEIRPAGPELVDWKVVSDHLGIRYLVWSPGYGFIERNAVLNVGFISYDSRVKAGTRWINYVVSASNVHPIRGRLLLEIVEVASDQGGDGS